MKQVTLAFITVGSMLMILDGDVVFQLLGGGIGIVGGYVCGSIKE